MQTGDPLEVFRPDIPSSARMYDYFLGGKDNYPSDREAGERAIAMMPPGTVQGAARQNRKFLGRAVRYLVQEAGIRQFLDIGTGMPTMGPVHEVAQALAPESRVVYVDHDPVVIAHAVDMLQANDLTAILKHDLREPDVILGDKDLASLLDLSQPVAVLLVAILHFVEDASDPRGIVTRLMDAVPPGSYLAISNATTDNHPGWAQVTGVYSKATSTLCNRTRDEVAALFEGYDLVEPGIVMLHDWHPELGVTEEEDTNGGSICWCGIARKPG
jgi:hypothetical protein